MLVCSPYAYGEPYKYITGNIIYEITETDSQYIVVADSQGNISGSRSQNIQERRLRLNAVDVIGAYILYKDYARKNKLTTDYFQVYVDGINLHYNATISTLCHEPITKNGRICHKYICNKADYEIKYATFLQNINLYSLLVNNYQLRRNEYNAMLLCNYPKSSPHDYIDIEKDFFNGNAQIPSAIRQLQSLHDRLENSLFAPDANESKSVISNALSTTISSRFYRAMCYVELISSSPLKKKEKLYQDWCAEISGIGNIWAEVLAFCAKECRAPKFSEMSISETIAAFPCAISPYSIRHATYEPDYDNATQYYANSRFREAATILAESIDVNGITPRTLNLLGASYRLEDKPELALPYLILCFRINPETPYLAGNIFLSLQSLKFPQIKQFSEFLSHYAKDAWSQEQIKQY